MWYVSSCLLKSKTRTNQAYIHISGAHFKWSEAKPYIAAVSERYQQIKRPPAIEIQDTPHFTHKDGKQVPWLCTVCREHIHGLVFQCVHCFDLALCLTCMETSSLSSKIPANHDPKHHVFNIRVPRMNPNLVDALCGSFEGYAVVVFEGTLHITHSYVHNTNDAQIQHVSRWRLGRVGRHTFGVLSSLTTRSIARYHDTSIC